MNKGALVVAVASVSIFLVVPAPVLADDVRYDVYYDCVIATLVKDEATQIEDILLLDELMFECSSRAGLSPMDTELPGLLDDAATQLFDYSERSNQEGYEAGQEAEQDREEQRRPSIE